MDKEFTFFTDLFDNVVWFFMDLGFVLGSILAILCGNILIVISNYYYNETPFLPDTFYEIRSDFYRICNICKKSYRPCSCRPSADNEFVYDYDRPGILFHYLKNIHIFLFAILVPGISGLFFLALLWTVIFYPLELLINFLLRFF